MKQQEYNHECKKEWFVYLCGETKKCSWTEEKELNEIPICSSRNIELTSECLWHFIGRVRSKVKGFLSTK